MSWFTSFPPPLLQDAIVHAMLAVGLFAGAVGLASYIPDWKQNRDNADSSGFIDPQPFQRLITCAEATAVSCVLGGWSDVYTAIPVDCLYHMFVPYVCIPHQQYTTEVFMLVNYDNRIGEQCV